MSDKTERFSPRPYLAPRYWPTWLGLGLLRLSALLPYRVLLLLGNGLGRLLYRLVSSRRHVARVNIGLCFPELSEAERERRVKGTFIATAISVFEGALAWWAGDARLKRMYRIEGLENLKAAQEGGKGVLLIGGHYTTLEISGRLLSFHCDKVQPIYKRAHNRLFNDWMVRSRLKHCDELHLNTDMRRIVRALKRGGVVWYAPDQDFGRERSVFAPFMGVATASLTATSGLARLSGAPVLPFWSERLPGAEGFLIRIGEPIEPFPGGDEVEDATRINAAIESQVRRAPEQYFWIHKRFKTRPPGEPDVYRK